MSAWELMLVIILSLMLMAGMYIWGYQMAMNRAEKIVLEELSNWKLDKFERYLDGTEGEQ